jgi:SOS-response transcriptional repressor LexA
MPAVVIPIGTKPVSVKRSSGAERHASWLTFEIARPGARPTPYGILFADEETDGLTFRLQDPSAFDELDEQESEVLRALPEDLRRKGLEMGGLRLLDCFEDSLSNFFRAGDRQAIVYSGDARATVDRLFHEIVDSVIRPFVTHLPVYNLRAAATKFGELMDSRQEEYDEHDAALWVRAPENLRLSEGMFVAYVVGRSMEPRIPDGSACIFRAPVAGSRNGRLLLIEKSGETDFSSRYTVKRYARQGSLVESAERESAIRLEPLNKEFPAFDLTEDEFRVIAEFVQVLPRD